jgi:hypothetical protein
MEARVDTTSTSSDGGYLLGFGLDYWQSLTAVWNSSYTTNKDAGVGRLKKVTKDWKWFGMSTASDADLQTLFKTHGAATTTVSPPSPPGNIQIK